MALYTKALPVYVSNSNDVQKRKTFLTASATFQPSSAAPPCGSKDFIVQLTCEDNPLFLYSLRISESDFHNLKSDQNLLVDFSGFPRMLVDLLESALKEDGKPEPKFLLYFSEEGCNLLSPSSSADGFGVLEVVESNKFKHLVHLSLKLQSASDNQLKKHLAECLQSLKQSYSTLEKQSKGTDSELKRKVHHLNESLAQKTGEVEKLKQLRQEETRKLQDHHAQALASCQEKLGQNQESLKDDHARMSSRLTELDKENQKLREDNGDLKVRADRLLAANREFEDDCLQWQGRYSELERELDEIPILRRQVDNLNQDLREKEHEIGKCKDKLRSLWQNKNRLEQTLEEKCSELENQKAETDKSVDIIRKMMSQNKAVKDKAKHKIDILTEQEKHVKTLEEECERLKKELETSEKKREELDTERKKLGDEMLQMSEKVVNAQKDVQSKESLITYLNRQLTDLKVTVSPTGGYGASARSAAFASPPTLLPTGPLSYRPVLGLTQATSSSTPTFGGASALRFGKTGNFQGISPISSRSNQENLNPGNVPTVGSVPNALEPNIP